MSVSVPLEGRSKGKGVGSESTDSVLLFLGTLFFLVLFLCRLSIRFRRFVSYMAYTSFVPLVATSHGAG